MRDKRFKFFLIILVAILFASVFYKDKIKDKRFNQSIQKDSKTIVKNNDDLYSYIKKFGPKRTVQRLNELVSEFGDCHQKAHESGRIAYEIYKEKAFQTCSAECHSGCYHGATEAYFREHGTANLTKDLNTLCSSELNQFFSHQCIHGVGHGLMAWANYDIQEALEACNLLEKTKDSCWTGVFMENIVGAIPEDEATKSGELKDKHVSRYLNNDPQYPCTAVSDKYKSSCYFLQTSRMMQLFNGDFANIGQGCLSAPNAYQRVCFESMGRDVGGVTRGRPDEAIKNCSYAPEGELRIGCLIGAVQDSFWDPTGQDEAIAFCKLLTDGKEKETCYSTIFERAPQVLVSKEDLKTFCAKAESYQVKCLSYVKI